MPEFRIVLALIALLYGWQGPAQAQEFAGSEACRSCHQDEYAAWQGSHHQLAMQTAAKATVLGDFNDAEFSYAGVTSRFFRRDEKFYARTDGADGQLADFEITHTFGVYPLQQYLVTFPDGRLQALGIAWDSRPAEEGGQRWFHLYPGEEVNHGDDLHWTGSLQNWNFMCADCHSTNLRKNYRAETDRFETTWSEISVGCEACHGPGSQHIEWSQQEQPDKDPGNGRGLAFGLNERSGVHWAMSPEGHTARRSQPNELHREIEICASCHSRRGIIAEGAAMEASFLDHYLPALLTDGLYHADGQIQDEVYVWGSYLQSRMHAAGVTCSDCHDPHSQQLKLPGDAVCTQCHQTAVFAANSHHHHPVESAGARCANCHMPETTYMVVDPRRDHSLRVPRPDLSAKYGTPNACNQCHQDRDEPWATGHFQAWFGEPGTPYQSWAAAFSAARSANPDAGEKLARLVTDPDIPAIARATAVLELGPFLDQRTFTAIQGALQDSAPLVRMAAARVMDRLPVSTALPLSAHLLQDDSLAVRTEAARVLAGAPRTQMNQNGADLLDRAIREYIATLELNRDRTESLMNLGNLYANLGDSKQAERQYRLALERDPGFVPGWTNLAEVLRSSGMEEEALDVLRQGLRAAPDAGALHHALGLGLIRQGQQQQALDELARAADLEPGDARFAYVYGVALNSTGQPGEALGALEKAHRRHPQDRDILFALATINRDLGRQEAALGWARKLLQRNPADAGADALMRSLSGGR